MTTDIEQTEQEPTSILDELANLPEPEPPAEIELTDEQMANSSVSEIEALLAEKAKPAEPEPEPPTEPTEPEADPDLAPETKPENTDSETPAEDFTPREKASYAQMQKHKERAAQMAEQNEQLQKRLEALEALEKQSSPEYETDAIDPDDFLTAGQFETALQNVITKRQQQAAIERQERGKMADQIGREFYPDYDMVVTPEAIQAIQTSDPERFDAIVNQTSPAQVARMAYETFKQTEATPAPPKTKPTIPNTPVPVPNRPKPPETLRADHVAYLQNKIANANSVEEMQQIQKELEGQYGSLYG